MPLLKKEAQNLKGNESYMKMKNYHCCATCIHFSAQKKDRKMQYRCVRLGYPTKTHYQFNCWVPKEQVRKLIEKDK